MNTNVERDSLFPVMGWGAFLACSWTWCIGMFLPVLLLRDLGLAGFAAFALPNIIGAAMFGAIFSNPQTQFNFLNSHRTAIWAFSIATVAFQAFFAVSLMLPAPISAMQATTLLGTAACAVAIRWLCEKPKQLLIASVITWIVSCGLMVVAARQGHEGPPADLLQYQPDRAQLIGLAAVCALGFALCPWLDRTFHFARQSLPGPRGTWAFALGFGVLFATMLGFTALYAREGTLTIVPDDGSAPFAPWIAFAPVVLSHIAMQLGFTIGAHLPWCAKDAPVDIGPDEPKARERLWVFGPLLVGGVVAMFASSANGLYELTGFEITYRCFMALYGLVFPSYVWICAPKVHSASAPTKRKFVVWVAAMAIAAPFFWIGFMQRRYEWITPGVAIILAARVFR